MIFSRQPSRNLTPEEQRIMRAHLEWAGRYAMLWIFVTIVIFGGFFFLFDHLGADDSLRTNCLVLLAAITVVNAIWRAAGVLAARIELMLLAGHRLNSPSQANNGIENR
jgi:hypothetical protein